MAPASQIEAVPPQSRQPFLLRLVRRLPAQALSRTFGRVADIRLARPFRSLLLRTFARAVGIDISEAELPLTEYPSLTAFFVRRLKPGARSWPSSAAVWACPVDGIVGQLGRLENGEAVQAKGHLYTIADLLGDGDAPRQFAEGSFLTIYLSPSHYHRIHTPAPGSIPRATYLPGSLFPVNQPAVEHIPRLFVRNERLVCYLATTAGICAVVAVGAYNVGRISTAFDATWSGSGKESWVTNRNPPSPMLRSYDPPVPVSAGDEIMAFHLGSTVVLLLPAGVRITAALTPGVEVRVGQEIGSYEP